MELIINTLWEKEQVEKTAIFGSRAMGNYKNGSDVDLVIYGENITKEMVNEISIKLNEELPLPYYFDVIHYESLKHDGLREHIDEFAKIIYKR